LTPHQGSDSARNATSESYTFLIRGLCGLKQDGQIAFRQLVPLVDVDDEVEHRAALPPTGGVVELRDLRQTKLLAVGGADELCRVESPALERREALRPGQPMAEQPSLRVLGMRA